MRDFKMNSKCLYLDELNYLEFKLFDDFFFLY